MIEYTEEEFENFPELLCFVQGHDYDYGYCTKCGYKDLEFFDESEE